METSDTTEIQDPQTTPRGKSSIFRRIILLTVIFVAFITQYIIFEHVGGKRALEAWKSAMREKGEKFTLEEIKPIKPSSEENGTERLLNGADQLNYLKSTCPFASGGGIPSMKIVAPGRAAVLINFSELPAWTASTLSSSQTNKLSWQALAKEVEAGDAALKQIKEALKQPNLGVELDYKKGFAILTPHLSHSRNIARWLSSSAMYHLHEKNLQAACEELQAIASLTRFQKDEDLIISQLVRIAVGSIGLNVTWQALQVDNWSEAQLEDLQSAWEMEPWFNDLAKSFEMERAVGASTFDQLRRSGGMKTARDLFYGTSGGSYGGGSSSEWPKELLFGLGFQIWRFAWSYHDELRAHKSWQASIDGARTMTTSKSWIQSKTVLDKEAIPPPDGIYDRMRHSVSAMLTPDIGRSILRVVRYETQRELTVVAIALKRYYLKFGKYPADLKELSPNFLKNHPVDFMNGESLHYKLNSDGTFTLYSVGENGVDNGGDSTGPYGSFIKFHEGDDIVWPLPASSKEVETYKAK